jgi:hypothetical protein
MGYAGGANPCNTQRPTFIVVSIRTLRELWLQKLGGVCWD